MKKNIHTLVWKHGRSIYGLFYSFFFLEVHKDVRLMHSICLCVRSTMVNIFYYTWFLTRNWFKIKKSINERVTNWRWTSSLWTGLLLWRFVLLNLKFLCKWTDHHWNSLLHRAKQVNDRIIVWTRSKIEIIYLIPYQLFLGKFKV